MQGTSLVSTANQLVGMLGGISTLIGCRDTVSREFNIFNSHNEMMDVMDATSCDLHGMHREIHIARRENASNPIRIPFVCTLVT